MSNLSICRPAYLTDASPGGATYRSDERTGAIHMRAPLTWSGVREYPQIRIGNRAARILRRPEQILRSGYLATCERLTPTHKHPRDKNGVQVLISAENYRLFAVGSCGDRIDREVINGYPVPVGNITVIDADCIASIKAGNDQVSQGFFALIAPPPAGEAREVNGETVGVWEGPHGPEEYDVEHICDPDDPAAIAYADAHPDFPREKIGANHIAVGIPAGRGLAQAQARPIESYDSADPMAGAILFLDESPAPVPAPAKARTMKRKISWSPKLPKGFSCGVAVPFLDEMEVEVEDGPDALLEFFSGMQSLISELLAKMAESEGAMEVAQGEAAVAGEQAAAAQGAATEAVAAADALTVERDALLAEVKPLRVAAVAAAKDLAAKVSPGVGLDAAEDLPTVRRAAVAAKLPALAGAADGVIEGAWSALVAGLDAAPITPGVTAPLTPSPGFMTGADEIERAPNKARKMFAVKN